MEDRLTVSAIINYKKKENETGIGCVPSVLRIKLIINISFPT